MRFFLDRYCHGIDGSDRRLRPISEVGRRGTGGANGPVYRVSVSHSRYSLAGLTCVRATCLISTPLSTAKTTMRACIAATHIYITHLRSTSIISVHGPVPRKWSLTRANCAGPSASRLGQSGSALSSRSCVVSPPPPRAYRTVGRGSICISVSLNCNS